MWGKVLTWVGWLDAGVGGIGVGMRMMMMIWVRVWMMRWPFVYGGNRAF